MALSKDAAARDAYIKAPSATLLRPTPAAPAAADPLLSREARAKDKSATKTAPDPTTLVRDRVLHLRSP